MTTLTAPAPQANVISMGGEGDISLFQLGCLFVIRASQKVRAGSATKPIAERRSALPRAGRHWRPVGGGLR